MPVNATMRAAILEAPRRMVLREVPIPEPESDWVRVRTKAAGVCGSDMHTYTGNHPWLAPGSPMERYVLGNIYGHEVAGVVDAVGEAVTSVKKGDRVAVNAIVPCLRCEYCRIGRYQVCPNLAHYGFQIAGGFAEYLLVPASNAMLLPDSISFEAGALLDVLVVGIHAVQRAGVTMADMVAILGAGPIGLAAAAAARRAGVRTSAITVRHPLHRRLAERIGVEHVVAPEELASLAKAITRERGFDAVIEAVGYKASTLQDAVDVVRRAGRIVFTGVYEDPVTLDFGKLLMKELTISASHAFGMWNMVPEFELAVEMVERGEFPANDLITHRFELDEINEAFHAKLDRPAETAKVQIVF
jgi:2-desacetyl-2-hydroxyethyl bacteriochlorophyllide A dehydrogenase